MNGLELEGEGLDVFLSTGSVYVDKALLLGDVSVVDPCRVFVFKLVVTMLVDRVEC